MAILAVPLCAFLGLFAVTGDNVAALITAGLTTINTVLLLWNQRHFRREVDPRLEEIRETAEHVSGIVDRRKLNQPTAPRHED